MKTLNSHSGLSLIATVLALLLFSLFLAVAVSLVTTGSNIGLQEEQGVQAFDIAEGGLERALRFILRDAKGLSNPCTSSETCACNFDIDGNGTTGDLTNISLGNGTFTVTSPASDQTYVTNPTALNGTLIADPNITSIPVRSDPQSIYASSGRIMIDREIIEYTSLTTNSFEGCRRGFAGTKVTQHADWTRVGQKQCLITSTGSITTNPLATVQRQVSTVTELQNGWISGGGGAEDLNEVHCTDTNNCWAVGTNGAIMQWNGTSWRKVTSPTGEDLNSVFMIDTTGDGVADDGWAVGDEDGNELILRWDGTAWTRLPASGSIYNENLNSVFCTSNTNCWAVGDDVGGATDSLIINWDGTQWTYVDPSGNIDDNLYSVYMFSTTDGWAVGENGRILRWNGASWNNTNSPTGENINSVFMVSANEVWIVGDDRPGGANNAIAYRWRDTDGDGIVDAAEWTYTDPLTNENLTSIYMLSPNDGWTIGDNGVIRRWNNPAANQWNSIASPTTENLNSVYMVTANDGWVVGDNGTILRWDGTSWTSFGGGRMLRWNGAACTDKTSTLPAVMNQALRSVSMLSYVDGWVVGNRVNNTATGWTILRWNPAGNTWILYSSINPATGAQTLRSVYMVTANDGWAVGNATGGELIIRWDGAAWNRVGPYAAIPDARLNSVHCVSANDCWAVGNASGGELIIRWNGATWNRVGPYAGIPDAQLNSVYCTSANNCWAVGNASGGNEVIINWNGITWSRSGPYGGIPNVSLNSVFCTSANDCWAVGNAGNIIRWNGATWSAVASPTTQDLNSVYMLSTTDGQAVGDTGTIIQWNGLNWTNAPILTTADLNGVCLIGTQTPLGQWEENYP